MNRMLAVTLREIFEQKEKFSGWLYCPPTLLSLDTQGVFIEEDIDDIPSDSPIPAVLEPCHLIEILDAASIEDIIDNAKAQLETVTIEDLFRAFIFYTENDAFIQFNQ